MPVVATDLQSDMWASFFNSSCAVTLVVVVGFELFFRQIELTSLSTFAGSSLSFGLEKGYSEKGSQAFLYVVVLL